MIPTPRRLYFHRLGNTWKSGSSRCKRSYMAGPFKICSELWWQSQSRNYCIIDTTFGNPVRAMYLGMALGYGKSFANLVNRSRDPEATIFTNARSKSVFYYRDQSELIDGVKEFLARLGAER